MFIHTFELPTGEVVKRTSQNRTYTHVIMVTRQKADGTLVYYVDGWSGSQQLAMKGANSTRNRLTIDPKKRAADTTGWYARYEQEHGTLVTVTAHPVTTFTEHTPKPRATKSVDNPGVE